MPSHTDQPDNYYHDQWQQLEDTYDKERQAIWNDPDLSTQEKQKAVTAAWERWQRAKRELWDEFYRH